MVNQLALTTLQMIDALHALNGGSPSPIRTLAQWAGDGLVVPSLRWDRTTSRGTPARGPAHPRLYSLGDLARARLLLRLRREGLSMSQVRAVFAHVSDELNNVLRPVAARRAASIDCVLVLRGGGWSAAVLRVGDVDYALGSEGVAQRRLPLSEVIDGNVEAARLACAG